MNINLRTTKTTETQRETKIKSERKRESTGERKDAFINEKDKVAKQ